AVQDDFLAVTEEIAIDVAGFVAGEDAGELGGAVREGEIDMARGLGAEVADFSRDPDLGDFFFEETANGDGDFGDREDLADFLGREEFAEIPLRLETFGHATTTAGGRRGWGAVRKCE